MVKAKKGKRNFLGMTDSDFSKENLIEGGLIRPAILMVSFLTFVIAMFMLLFSLRPEHGLTYLKWGGSLIIFSFILNIYSIYESLGDAPSIFKKMNLGFKFTLFLAEIVAFNWVLTLVLY